MIQPRRSQPCPCGSGKKYKNCCEEAAPRASAIPRDVLLGSPRGTQERTTSLLDVTDGARALVRPYGELLVSYQLSLVALDTVVGLVEGRPEDASAAADYQLLLKPEDNKRRSQVVEGMGLGPAGARRLTEFVRDYSKVAAPTFVADMAFAIDNRHTQLSEAVKILDAYQRVADWMGLALAEAAEALVAGETPYWPEEDWAKQDAKLQAA